MKIYYQLPPSAQSIAASIRGYYLKSWRYGNDTENLIAVAHEREHWDSYQWNAWREERLAMVLDRAATRVPYYRDQWKARRQTGDTSSWSILDNWPILEKESVRQMPLAFIADDCKPHRMFHDHTSGTSGKSINLWSSEKTLRNWYALFEARCRNWHGISREDRWAILGGQLVIPASKRTPPFWVWNRALKQLYMSSYHLAPDLIPDYINALKEFRVKYIYGYSSSLYELAYELLRVGRKDIQMEVVLTNAEPLFDYQRTVIEQAFGCPVRETYGMAELVAASSECERGSLHIWPEVGYLETVNNTQSGLHENVGDLVCTGLLNIDMPLIRYRVGDRAGISNGDSRCSCGRQMPIMSSVEGRSDDVLITPDGRRVGRLDPVFKSDLPIREAQVIQESLHRVRVRYVSDSESDAVGKSLVNRLQERLGAVEVILERVNEIPRGANGKFRAVVCMLPAEDKRTVASH